eukprot:Awhi_evm1s7122
MTFSYLLRRVDLLGFAFLSGLLLIDLAFDLPVVANDKFDFGKSLDTATLNCLTYYRNTLTIEFVGFVIDIIVAVSLVCTILRAIIRRGKSDIFILVLFICIGPVFPLHVIPSQ